MERSVFQSYLCPVVFALFPQHTVHLNFLFFSLYSVNKIEVIELFLMESLNFFFEAFYVPC